MLELACGFETGLPVQADDLAVQKRCMACNDRFKAEYPRPLVDYPPQIGTLVSEMTWMRTKVVRTVKGLTTDQLDYLLDDKANRIGALLLHLAATEPQR